MQNGSLPPRKDWSLGPLWLRQGGAVPGSGEHWQNVLAKWCKACSISQGNAAPPPGLNAKPGMSGKPCVTQLRGASSNERAVILQPYNQRHAGRNCLIYTHILPCAAFVVICDKLPCKGFCDIRHLHSSLLSQPCHTN